MNYKPRKKQNPTNLMSFKLFCKLVNMLVLLLQIKYLHKVYKLNIVINAKFVKKKINSKGITTNGKRKQSFHNTSLFKSTSFALLIFFPLQKEKSQRSTNECTYHISVNAGCHHLRCFFMTMIRP